MSDATAGLGAIPKPVLIVGGLLAVVAMVAASRAGASSGGVNVSSLNNGGDPAADAQRAESNNAAKLGAFNSLASLAGIELTTRGGMHVADVQAESENARTVAQLAAARVQSSTQLGVARLEADRDRAVAGTAADVARVNATATVDVARVQSDAQRYVARSQKEAQNVSSVVGGIASVISAPFSLLGKLF